MGPIEVWEERGQEWIMNWKGMHGQGASKPELTGARAGAPDLKGDSGVCGDRLAGGVARTSLGGVCDKIEQKYGG
jgi:hypothetical protein